MAGVFITGIGCLFAAGCLSAYFTRTDGVGNTFTVGHIKGVLSETDYDKDSEIAIGKEIPRNPQVTNKSDEDVYAFITVTVPKKEKQSFILNGKFGEGEKKDTYNTNDWYLISTNTTGETENVYVYVYGDPIKCTKLKKGETTEPLYESVTPVQKTDRNVKNSMTILPVADTENNPLKIWNNYNQQ